MLFSKPRSTSTLVQMPFRVLCLVLFPLSIAGARVFAGLNSNLESSLSLIPLRCPLHFFFGIKCPTCGLGHSLVFAWLGEFKKSWDYHPLGLILLGVTGLVWCALLLNREAQLVKLAKFLQTLKSNKSALLSVVLIYSIWGFLRH